MNATIATTELQRLMKGTFFRVPTKSAVLTLTAIEGRLILCSGTGGASTAAAVTSPGEVTVSAKTFRKVLDTYEGTASVVLTASAAGLCINSFKMPISSWNPAPLVPDGFV